MCVHIYIYIAADACATAAGLSVACAPVHPTQKADRLNPLFIYIERERYIHTNIYICV